MSKEIERQLLGHFMVATSLFIRDLGELFVGYDTKTLYRAMSNVVDDGGEISANSVIHFVGDTVPRPWELMADILKHASHMSAQSLAPNVRWCIRKMREEKVRRDLVSDASNPAIGYDAIKDLVLSFDNGMETNLGSKTEQGLRELLVDLSIPESQKMYSGFESIDKATRGFRRGDLVSFMARTTVGKTWILLNIADTLARRGFRVSFFSMEGALAGTMERLVQIHEGISMDLITPYFIETTMLANEKFANDYKSVSWHNQIYSVEDMSGIVDKEHPDVVFIDFLNLVRARGDGSPYERTTQVVTDMKAMAIEKNILLIYANQISRLGEDGSIPVKLHHARDSGACEELSDFIVGAWRPGMHSTEFEEKYKIKMELLKCKRGYTTGLEARLWPCGKIKEKRNGQTSV